MTKIKDIPEVNRPIERLINNGVSALSIEELLAILIKTGNKHESSKDLALKILSELDNVSDLNNITLEKLKQIKGIGDSKACTLISALELSKRINRSVESIISKKGNNPSLIFNYFKDILKDKKQEYFYALYLDNKKTIIKEKLLFIGTINYSLVHPREVFKEAFILSASSIILVHNHPTGNVIPSETDIKTTDNLKEIGELMGIKIIDHIIIGLDKYYSFYEEGIL